MTDKIDYNGLLNDVVELINATGREIQLQRVQESQPDLEKPWRVDTDKPVIAEILDNIGTFVPAWGNEFGTSWVSDEMLARVSTLCLVPGSADPKGMLRFTHLKDGDTVYGIEWAQILHPGPLTLLYIFGLKS